MSNLDSYHPFRASVQPGALQGGNQSQNNTTGGSHEEFSSNKANNDDEEYKPWFSWKTKLRLFIGTVAFGILYYIGSSVYASFVTEELKDHSKEASFLQEMQGHDDSILQEEVVYFDKRDLDDRGRSVQEARQKAGFLKSIFCKGGKKSSFFCD